MVSISLLELSIFRRSMQNHRTIDAEGEEDERGMFSPRRGLWKKTDTLRRVEGLSETTSPTFDCVYRRRVPIHCRGSRQYCLATLMRIQG